MKSSPASVPETSKPSLESKPALRPIKNPKDTSSSPPSEIMMEESTAEFELIPLEINVDRTGGVAKVLKKCSVVSNLPKAFTPKALT